MKNARRAQPAPSYTIGHGTDCGEVREQNEDTYIAEPGLGLYCVIDGMGGHAGGEVAASIASKQILGRMKIRDKDPATRVREAIALANREIYKERERRPEFAEMACVLTLASIEENQVTVGHVGDTRLYKIREDALTLVTQDHSPVGMLVREHKLTEVQAMKHPNRNLVSRDVGSADRQPFTPEFIDIETFEFEADSALLISSDGLFDQVTPDKILATVTQYGRNPQRAVATLIELANKAGGKDNVTAILVCGPLFAAACTVVRSASTERLGLEGPRAGRRGWVIPVLLLVVALAGVLAWKQPWKQAEVPTSTIYVDPEIVGEDARHFRSLASAIEAAPSGSVIKVLGGRYAGPITLRAGLQLQAARGRDVTLFIEGASRAVVTADDLVEPTTMEGFRIIATGALAGVELRGSWVILKNNTISGGAQAGVRVSGGSTVEMSASQIEAGPATVGLVSAGSTLDVKGNQFRLLNGVPAAKAIEIDATAGEYKISVEKNELINCPGDCVSGINGWRETNRIVKVLGAPAGKSSKKVLP